MSTLELPVKLSISQASLAAGLSQAARLANTRGRLPVLAMVQLMASESGLQLAATDLELSVILRLDAQVENASSICVPAHTFADLVRAFSHAQVTLQFKRDKLEVACGRSKAALSGVSTNEFPELPEAQVDDGIPVPAQKLKTRLQQVIFAASSNESRVALTGVLLVIEEDTLTLAASDSFRISESRLTLETPTGKSLSYLVPARALLEVLRLIGDCEQIIICPTQNKGQVAFVLPGCTLISQLIGEIYPDYQEVIPRRHIVRAVLPTAALLTACKRAEIFARENTNMARLLIRPGLLEIAGNSEERGSTASVLEAQVTGGELEIAFEAVFLREALQAIGTSSVAIEVTTPNDPAVFRPVGGDGFVHVLMSMHVG